MGISHFVSISNKVESIVASGFKDWSLSTGMGGGLQIGKIAGLKLFAPPPPFKE